jgi:hypothetical protein
LGGPPKEIWNGPSKVHPECLEVSHMFINEPASLITALASHSQLESPNRQRRHCGSREADWLKEGGVNVRPLLLFLQSWIASIEVKNARCFIVPIQSFCEWLSVRFMSILSNVIWPLPCCAAFQRSVSTSAKSLWKQKRMSNIYI